MNSKFIVLDCETGGLEHDKNPITQVGLVVLDAKKMNIIDQYETFVRPYNDLTITTKSLEASRVSMEEINAGIDHIKLLADLIKIFKKHTSKAKDGKPILVGHNFQFDIGFLDYLFKLRSKNIYDFISKDWYCTMSMMKMYERKERAELAYTLTACCERFGIELKAAHGAMNDVIATTDLFTEMLNIFNPSSTKSIKTKGEKTDKPKKDRDEFFFEF